MNINNRQFFCSKMVAFITILVLSVALLGVLSTIFDLGILDFIKFRKVARVPHIDELQEAVVLIDTENSVGTGFNIDMRGLVITNLHVVSNSEIIEVATSQGEIYEGTVISSNEECDVAVIKIPVRNLPVVTLADKEPRRGDKVRIIGWNHESLQVLAEDMVRGKAWIKGWDAPVPFLQGEVSPGNSGSPVFNREGNVVGMVFGTLINGENKKSIIFIPASEIRNTIEKGLEYTGKPLNLS